MGVDCDKSVYGVMGVGGEWVSQWVLNEVVTLYLLFCYPGTRY